MTDIHQNTDRWEPGEQTQNDPPAPGASGPDQQILFDRHADIGKMLRRGAERRQNLPGFDEEYVDFVDYIVRCTHRIWEQHGIGLIYTHYNQNTPVYSSNGELYYGRDKVVENTIISQAAMPDQRIFADDVVWGGNEREGFLSSHRYTVIGRNTGYTAYGPPTGRRVRLWGIANCLVKENRIVEEWLFHNELSFIRQLGLPLRETILRAAPRQTEWLGPDPVGEFERLQGQDAPPSFGPEPAGFDLEDMVRRSLHEIWNRRMLNLIDEYYVPNYLYHGANDREYYGRGQYRAYVLSVLAMFPDATVMIDDLRWVGNDRDGYRTAVRWSLLGTHAGPGVYGEPTQRPVHMKGITQHFVRDGRFIQEWTTFNELEILYRLWSNNDERGQHFG